MKPVFRVWTLAAALFFASAFFTSNLRAHGFNVGDLAIEHPYSVASPVGSNVGGMYINAIKNKGAKADFLVSASSPAAKTVELHLMQMDGEVMRMREVKQIEIPANGILKMARGQTYHLMLIGITAPLKVGDKFPLKLKFANAGEVEVIVNVEKSQGSAHAHH